MKRSPRSLRNSLPDADERKFPRDRYAKVDGFRLRYWVRGHGENVLLLPALGGSVEDWLGAFERLDDHFRLWALELPGLGRSDKPFRGYSVDFFVHVALGFMSLQEIERAHVVGLSMGGGIGIALTLQMPVRVQRLVLVSSALLGRRLHPFLHLCTLPLLGELLLCPTPKVVKRYISRCFADPSRAPAEWISAHVELASLPGAQQAFLAILRSANGLLGTSRQELRPILSALPRISAKTLIICGERDNFIPTCYARRAAALIPNAQYVSFPNCGHAVPIERPDLFYPLVSSFLKEGATEPPTGAVG